MGSDVASGRTRGLVPCVVLACAVVICAGCSSPPTPPPATIDTASEKACAQACMEGYNACLYAWDPSGRLWIQQMLWARPACDDDRAECYGTCVEDGAPPVAADSESADSP